MGNPLQDRHTATEWALGRQVIEIASKISDFKGLATIVEGDLAALESDSMPSGWRDSVVVGRLQFGFADEEQRLPIVCASASTEVDAVCQRCLQPFRLALSVEPKLLLLEQQESAEGYDDYEVWELEQPTLRPQDIVEELLIMAMPLAATHNSMSACKALSTEENGTEQMRRPFATLRSQMQRDEKGPDE